MWVVSWQDGGTPRQKGHATEAIAEAHQARLRLKGINAVVWELVEEPA